MVIAADDRAHPPSYRALLSEGGSPSADELDHQHYQRQYQQDVDVGSNCVEADQSNEPQHKQNYKNRPQHGVRPLLSISDSKLTERYGARFANRVAVQSKIRGRRA